MKLKDALVTAARFSKANDAELAWIDAVIDIQINADKEEVSYIPHTQLIISINTLYQIIYNMYASGGNAGTAD